MHRLALRSLVLAATALLLTTSACDSGDTKADGGKKAEVAKADDGAKADGADAGAADAGAADAGAADAGAADAGAADAGAADAGAADAGAETGGATGADGGETGAAGETGDAVPAAGEDGDVDAPDDGGDKPDDGGTKTKKKPPAGDKTPAVAKIDGKPLYVKKCKSCHGLDGKGDTTIGKKVDIPSLVKTKLSKAKVVANITNGVKDTKMKSFKAKLTKEEIDAVSAYVKKL